ncbi:MAG: CBS domain-containing protein [Pseudooceanicola sp.]|nr:CBS domain-containing protein [Pseudooceanicola sp.]
MLVQQLLKSKPDQVVVTVKPGTSLAKAAEILALKRIGAVIVSPDGSHVAGILSERDIVRELGKRGVGCMSDKVDDVMTAKIVGCAASDTVDQVMQAMTAGRFRHMPVMEDEVMIGLISIGDVVKAQISEIAMEKQALEHMIMGH